MVDAVNKVLQNARRDPKRQKRAKVPLPFTTSEICLIKILLKFLKPFSDLTDNWQGDSVTSSMVIIGVIDAFKGDSNEVHS